MRPTIVLLGTATVMNVIATRLKSYGTYEEGDIFDYLSVEECLFKVDMSGDVLDDYDDGELDIPDGGLSAILVEYQSVSCVRRLLLAILPGQVGFLDSNHGSVTLSMRYATASIESRTGIGGAAYRGTR
ncbi:hypothetical protein ACBI99_18355 [Nonomuraea sp. ATR24]|uniref:hypothetical protein n=1 Tax=Nonomuraea sp. ATR24 TaxID=1676744 RepID=UPI0035C170B5